ncbi:uncharacterized protein LOC134182510 isoform X3 [Corticium candelabrum]|uniref:uncharacterized protein LOC134182510 isoform X3 n=1 Tax=Corticium candelabrum TaxID=121492 RepID=UPI002E26D89F|nr:uncharacterized protein LOC134182510 isoform X3 [Corticium candelabrum]
MMAESISVELTGWRKKAVKPFPDPKFKVNMSCSECSYQVSEPKLKITIFRTDDECGRIKEHQVLKMSSVQQLTAWTAELIQASTFEPENTLQRCFHVVVPEVSSEQTAPYFKHLVLQARHPHNCQLVVRDPLRLTDVKYWDLARLKSFTFEFIPRPLVCFKLTDELLSSDLTSAPDESVHFLSAEVARQALNFVELLLTTRSPKLYVKAARQVSNRQTSQGEVTSRVTFDFQSKHDSSVQQFLPVSPINSKVKLPSVSRFSCDLRDANPYAVVDVVARLTAPLPPKDLIRPGVVLPRILENIGYVKFSKVETFNPLSQEKRLPIKILVDPQPDADYDDVAEGTLDDVYDDVEEGTLDDVYDDVEEGTLDDDYDEVAADTPDDVYEDIVPAKSEPCTHNT